MADKLNDISKEIFYELLLKQTESLLTGESDPIANMANLSALLFQNLTDVNWVGFYRFIDSQLVLGPFQGKTACIRIDIGKGVCGASFQQKKALVVDDVHQFSGHIACDSDSNSEIVVPLIKNQNVFGVLDIDSPIKARFNQVDKSGLQKIIDSLINHTDF